MRRRHVLEGEAKCSPMRRWPKLVNPRTEISDTDAGGTSGSALHASFPQLSPAWTLPYIDPTSLDVTEIFPDPAAALLDANALTTRLTRLQRITASLGNVLTIDAVAEAVLREAIVALECDAGAVLTRTADGPLELLKAAGWLDPLMASYEAPSLTSEMTPYGDVVEGQRAVFLESHDEMEASYPAFASVDAQTRCAWMFVPLAIENHTVGALAFGFGTGNSFWAIDRQFVDTVGRYCAQALDRVQLRITAATAVEEAQQARLVAEQANNAKSIFLRAISHELRTPLAAIAGYTEILDLEIHGPITPEQASDVDRIRRASAYLLRLIDDVLMVSRVEGGRPMAIAPVALSEMLLEVSHICSLQATACGVSLVITPLHAEVYVAADAERLEQILLNLVTNALKFTSKDGHVTMSVEVADDMVHVRTRDTGIGIYSRDVDRIFEAFVQIDRHRTAAEHQGSGLGLSISRDLARAMHGDITLDSIPGVGSTFTLTLPKAPSGPIRVT
jgi:signal transduction histidine kinase